MESSLQSSPKPNLAQADIRLSSNGNQMIKGKSSNCLKGFVFAFTGTFDRSRQQMRSTVLMHGGGYCPVVNNLVTHFVVGENPEFSDVWMAKRLKRPMINESMFLNIIKVRSEPPKSFTSVRVAKDEVIPKVISKIRVLGVEQVRAVCSNEIKAPPMSSEATTRVLLPQQQPTASSATRIMPRNADNALELALGSKKVTSLQQVNPGSSKTSNPTMKSRQSENIPSNASQLKNYCQVPTVRPSQEAQAMKILKRGSTALNDSFAGVEMMVTIPKSPKRPRPAMTKAEIQKLVHRLSCFYHGRKEIPEVKPDCLNGHEFVINGYLRAVSRDEATDLIISSGGFVVENVTKSATHMLLGTNFGPVKFAKAEAMGAQMLSVGEFLNLILGGNEMPEPSEVDAEADEEEESPALEEEIIINEGTAAKMESTASTSVQVKFLAPATIEVELPESSVPLKIQEKVIQVMPKILTPPSKATRLNFIDEYCKSVMMKPGPYRNARSYRVGDWYTLNNQPTVNIDIKKHSLYPLQGKKFVITGMLKTIPNREQLKCYLVECGAQVVAAVSKNVTHLIVGDEPGVSQINRAEQNGVTKIIDEDQLMLMLTDKKYEDILPASIFDD